MDSSAFRKYLCEFIGTFSLVFFAAGAVMISVVSSNIGTLGSGLISGGIITVVIFTFGQISGAHVNPALSLAAAFLGELEWRLVPGYVFSSIGRFHLGRILTTLVGRPSRNDWSEHSK